MRLNDVLKLVPRSAYPWLILSKLFMSGFNLFVSIMIQVGIAIAMQREGTRLWGVLIALILGSLLYGLIFYKYSMLMESIKKHISETVSLKLMRGFLNYQNSKDIKEGELVNLVNQDAETIANYLYSGVSPLFDFSLSLLLGLGYVFIASYVAGFFYLVIGITFFLLARGFYTKQAKARRKYERLDDQHKRFFTELYRNIPLLSVFHVANWALDTHKHFYDQKMPDWKQNVNTAAANNGLFTGGIYFVEIISLVGGLFLVKNNFLNLNVMVGVWNAGIGSILDPFMSLPVVTSFLAQQKVAIDRVNKRLAAVKTEQTHEDNVKSTTQEPLQKLIFHNVDFTYPSQTEPVFEKLNLSILKSQITFVVGHNGAGKTTLIKLLLNLLDPGKGSISAVNEKGQQRTQFQGALAYVPQRNQLFNTTVWRNLTLDKPYDRQDVHQALQAVNMDRIIDALPDGWHTEVGKVTNFSEGQMRRLSIARALLAHKQFLIMDEPFSDLDARNQSELMHTVRELSQKIGVLIITHTFDLIQDSDTVIKVGK